MAHRTPDPGLDDDSLLEAVQRQTFRFFRDGAHPQNGCARDRHKTAGEPPGDLVAVGGTGFGLMALVAGVARGWLAREEWLDRLSRILAFLERADRFHGAYPHFLHGATARTVPLARKDDGADLVETALLFQGLICTREFLDAADARECGLRGRIDRLWDAVEWTWFVRHGSQLSWHWSPRHGWGVGLDISGWNECLIAHVLAAASDSFPVDPAVYHDGFARGGGLRNGRAFHGIELPLGVEFGGPLFFAHYSFCGIDPRGLGDRHCDDYWEQNVRHARINHAHCVANPRGYAGYGAECWGLSASHTPRRYGVHCPVNDAGIIAPTAALSSFPYLPREAMQALRGFLARPRLWGRFGFVDAFSPHRGWHARTYLAINQGPIVAMIENHRSGLLWNLFMQSPQAQAGLRRLGFRSPWLEPARRAAHS